MGIITLSWGGGGVSTYDEEGAVGEVGDRVQHPKLPGQVTVPEIVFTHDYTVIIHKL